MCVFKSAHGSAPCARLSLCFSPGRGERKRGWGVEGGGDPGREEGQEEEEENEEDG